MVPRSRLDGDKWGTTVKVIEVVPGKEYWIAAMTEEKFPHVLTSVLELRNCAPTVGSDGSPMNPQVVWERAPYTHEVNAMTDPDFMTLYFKGASADLPDGARINNLQRVSGDQDNRPSLDVKVRQEVPYANQLLLSSALRSTFPHSALDSPQATLDDLQWILTKVWATGQHKLIKVRQIGRGTGNDGSLVGPVSNGAGKYLINLYSIESESPDGVGKEVLAGELDMGGIVMDGVYSRGLIPFTRTFADSSTYAELFIGKNLLNSDGSGYLDKNYKIATPNEEWAKKTVIFRPEIDEHVRPHPKFW